MRKKDPYEIMENPAVLTRQDISITDVKLFGIRLLDDCHRLKFKEVEVITLVKLPEGAKRASYQTDKSLIFEFEDKRKTFTLKQQYEAVIQHGGVFHTRRNASYIINEQRVIGMKFYNSTHLLYDTPKEQIEATFGKADEIAERFFDEDGSLSDTVYKYHSKPMTIDFDEYTQKISTIHIGVLPFTLSHQRAAAETGG